MSAKYAKLNESTPLLDDGDRIVTVETWVESFLSALSKIKEKIHMKSPRGHFKYIWKAAFFATRDANGRRGDLNLLDDQFPSLPEQMSTTYDKWFAKLSEMEIIVPAGYYKGRRLALRHIFQQFGRSDSKECHKYYLALSE